MDSKTKKFIDAAMTVHGKDKFDYSETHYIKAQEKVSVRCLQCNKVILTYPFNHVKGSGCRECNKKHSQAYRKRATSSIRVEYRDICIRFD